MKKTILNLGKVLSKGEQKKLNGGNPVAFCFNGQGCPPGTHCIGDFCFKDDNNGGGGNGGGSGCTVMKILCEYEGDTCCLY